MPPPGELAHSGPPEVREVECGGCGAPYQLSIGFVMLDVAAHAIYYAACHHHEGVHDAWIDVILGSWSSVEEIPDPDDHTTFSCRVGPGSAAPHPYASLVQATVAAGGDNSALFGEKLSREAALAHPRLAAFWRVVDFIVDQDPQVRRHLGMGAV